jgi:quercetin dioxygenase-like cupin family protein
MQNDVSKTPENKRTRYVLGGTVMEQHLSGSDTGSLFSLFENQAPGSARTPIHVHDLDDETFYIIEGKMTVLVNGVRFTLGPGESIFLPRRVPHQLINETAEAARYLLLCTPSGFEGFLAAGGSVLPPGTKPKPVSSDDIERMRNAAPAFGITLLQDWPVDHTLSLIGHE